MNVKGLIAVLLDPAARSDERDDAAIDLGQSDEPAALAALLTAARNADESPLILASAGEALAHIAARMGQLDPTWTTGMTDASRHEFTGTLAALRPDLLGQADRD